MKIAVIGNGFYPTFDWLKTNIITTPIINVNLMTRTIKTLHIEYIIVQSKTDAEGQIYHGYIIAPTYFDLVGFVKARCELG